MLLLAAFAIALGLFVDVLEDELAARVVRVELHEMPGHAPHGPAPFSDQTGGLRRWMVPVFLVPAWFLPGAGIKWEIIRNRWPCR